MILFSGIAASFLLITFILTRKISVIIKIILAIFVGLSALSFFLLFRSSVILTRGPEESWYAIAPWKHIILFAIMLLGMATNYFFEYIQARIKAKESRGQVHMPKFIWEKFVLPFIISGIVFGYFWGQHGKETMNLTVALLCYQNGYFWQTIVEKSSKSIKE